MALESATYIQSLASSNPPAGDPAGQAADHIRLIKSVLLSTFPNLNAPVTSTPLQLNSPVPRGTIVMWNISSSGAIPTGWALCDGGVYPRADGLGNIGTPYLLDRFIVGSGATYGNGTSGGSATHSHNITIGGTNLNQAHIPNLAIVVSDPGHNHGVNDPGHSHSITPGGTFLTAGGGQSTSANIGSSTSANVTGIYLSPAATGISAYTSATGGGVGQSHTHGAYADVQSNLPPYVALAYIMKL